MSEFYIDVLDSTGAKLGDGPLATVTRVEDTRKLDQIGSASFDIPAADPRCEYIVAGRQFDIYDRVDGYIGRFSYGSRSIDESRRQAMMTVRLYDQLKELSRTSVNFRRTYADTDPATIIAALIALATGWTATVDAGMEAVSVTYEGESVFRAIDTLRETLNKHLRLGAASELEFGAFGADSGVRLMGLRGQVQADIEAHPEIALVDSIRLVDESAEIFNRVIPLGAGQGVAQLTLEEATYAGDYVVQTGTNADSSSFYYLEDAASVAAYGRRDMVLSFPDIRPITNSDANIENAANVLKIAAEEWLKQHLSPTVTYDVTLRGLRQAVSVGDTVRLCYCGRVEDYSYIDVDEDFYVMEVTRSRTAEGNRSARLVISSAATVSKTDADVIADVVNDVAMLKVHVPATLAYAPIGPYTRRMNSANDAEFTARIGDEVLYLNYAILRFRTFPLRSSLSSVANGGGATVASTSAGGATVTSTNATGAHTHAVIGTTDTDGNHRHTFSGSPTDYAGAHTHTFSTTSVSNGGSHSHDVTISAHTHNVTISNHTHTINYGIYEDTNYPQVISIEIDGVDRTVALGGTWAPGNASVEVELDITTYLVNAVGGLRQNHRIVFSCTTAQGEIEAEIDMLVTIQAIAV